MAPGMTGLIIKIQETFFLTFVNRRTKQVINEKTAW